MGQALELAERGYAVTIREADTVLGGRECRDRSTCITCNIAQMQHAYAMHTILHHRANIQTISRRSIYSAGPALPGATVRC